MYRKRFLAVGFLTATVLLLASAVLAMPSLLFLKSSEIVLTAKRDAFASYETSSTARTLSIAVADVNARLAVFPPTETASPLIADFMNPVLLAKTPSIHLIGFSYQAGTKKTEANVKITGTADSRVALLSFVDRLKKVGSFGGVNVPITNFIKDSNVPFTVTATISLK